MSRTDDWIDAVVSASDNHIMPDEASRMHGMPDAEKIAVARALLSAAGYAVVPVKPTNRMCAAGGPEVRKACGLQEGNGDMQTIWTAMLAASEPTR